MDYSRNLEIALSIASTFYKIMGLNIIDANYRPSYRTGLVASMAVFGNVGIVYTLYCYRSYFIMILRCLSIAPEVFLASFKMYTVIKSSKILSSTVSFLRKVYLINSGHIGVHRMHAFLTTDAHFRLALRFSFGVLVFNYIVMASTPFYAKWVLGQKEMFFEMLIPGLSPENNTDFLISISIQFILLTAAFVGSNAMDLIILTVVIHLSLLSGLFLAAMKELASIVDNVPAKNNHDEINFKLRNCAGMHQDLIEYIALLNQELSQLFFFQTATSAWSLAMNCFCIMKTDWPGAYSLSIFAFIKIFLPCALGTFVDSISDNVTSGIYDFPWYLLPSDSQKTIYLLLMRSQNFSKLTIANVQVPLNVRTGAMIMKAIYSYLMLLLSFAE